MGLIFIKTVEGNSLLGIWEIDEHIELLANQFETIPEQPAIKTLKRKKEFIATRLLLDAMYAGVAIGYHTTGKPYLLNDDCAISISHSKNIVCILLNKTNNVGFDVQFASPKISRIKEKFMSATELATLNATNETDALHLYWCAKEALYKLTGEESIDFIKHLFVASFPNIDSGKTKGTISKDDNKTEVMLWYQKLNDYYLVYTIE